MDDVDRWDDPSLRVVLETLRDSSFRLVVTTSTDPHRAISNALRDLLVERAPEQVRVPHLDLPTVAVLLNKVLGAPADAALATEVLAQSGGNARASCSLARAARASGIVALEGGWWRSVGSFDGLQPDGLTLTFLSSLGAELVDALELLACLGPTPRELASQMIAPQVLDELLDCGRLVRNPFSSSDELLAVAPPALARSIRSRIGPSQQHAMLRRFGAELPMSDAGHLRAFESMDESAVAGADSERWSVPLASLVQERASARLALLREQWTTERSVTNANTYLDALLSDERAGALAGEVFERTQVSADDAFSARASFAFHEARWSNWSGRTRDQVRAQIEARLVDPATVLDEDHLQDRIVHAMREGEDPKALAIVPDSLHGAGFIEAFDAAQRTSAILDAGFPDIACQVPIPHIGSDPETDHYLNALAAESIAMLGQLDEAEAQQRGMLVRAWNDADVLGVRVHASSLALTLYFASRPEDAWRVLSGSLRLGAGGPLQSPYHRRGLALAAMLQVHAGNLAMAHVLLQELQDTSQFPQPLVRSLDAAPQIAALSAAGDRTAAARLAWDSGLRLAEAGLLRPAMLAWMGMPVIMTRSQAVIARDLCGHASIPLLAPYMLLHLSLAVGDAAAGLEALTETNRSVAPNLVRAAEQFLADQVDPIALRRPGNTSEKLAVLTPRQTEIALLARDGLTNSAIASILQISVRTVENHLSHTLRALHLSSRRALASDPRVSQVAHPQSKETKI